MSVCLGDILPLKSLGTHERLLSCIHNSCWNKDELEIK